MIYKILIEKIRRHRRQKQQEQENYSTILFEIFNAQKSIYDILVNIEKNLDSYTTHCDYNDQLYELEKLLKKQVDEAKKNQPLPKSG